MNSDARPCALSALLDDLRTLGRPGVRFATALGPIAEGQDAVRVAWAASESVTALCQLAVKADLVSSMSHPYPDDRAGLCTFRLVDDYKSDPKRVAADPHAIRAAIPLTDAAVARLWGRQP